MVDSMKANVAVPRLGQWDIAQKTTPRAGVLPLELRKFARGVASFLEWYNVIDVDVVIIGIDPIISLLAADQISMAGRSVLLVSNHMNGVNEDLQRCNLVRSSLFPDVCKEEICSYYRFDPGLIHNQIDVVTVLSDRIIKRTDADGRPRVTYLEGCTLGLDNNVCAAERRSQILWPFAATCHHTDSPVVLRAMEGVLKRRIAGISYRNKGALEVQVAVAKQVVMVSPVASLMVADNKDNLYRLAGAARPIGYREEFVHKDRYMDIRSALTVNTLLGIKRGG
jgi:hypothetical protein